VLGVVEWLILGQGLTVRILVVISRYEYDVGMRERYRGGGIPRIVLSHCTVSFRKLLKEFDKNLGYMINVYILLMWKVYRGIG
jgi:hypothetical protein